MYIIGHRRGTCRSRSGRGKTVEYPGWQQRAISPFRSLFGIRTYADEAVRYEGRAAFLTETCDRSIVMETSDMLEVEEPTIAELATGA